MGLEIYKRKKGSDKAAYYLDVGISAGFPSPATDFMHQKLSLDELLIKDEEATFYARVTGNSMEGAGLNDGDLLVIDRSLEAHNNSIAVCYVDGEFTVKRLKVEQDCVYLIPENKEYKPLKITEENQLIIWGVVSYVIKKVQ